MTNITNNIGQNSDTEHTIAENPDENHGQDNGQVSQDTETKEQEQGSEAEERTNDGEDTERVEFPKKAVRAIERRDKTIGKLKQRLSELEASFEQKKQQVDFKKDTGYYNNNADVTPPSESDFESVEDYYKALGAYEKERELKTLETQRKEESQKAALERWTNERIQYINDRVEKVKNILPDFDATYQENADIISDLNPFVRQAILEAEKPEIAFYHLAKSGQLEELNNMSPMQAFKAILEAEGKDASIKPPVSKAPEPLKTKQYGAPQRKTMNNMTSQEYLNYIMSQKK